MTQDRRHPPAPNPSGSGPQGPMPYAYAPSPPPPPRRKLGFWGIVGIAVLIIVAINVIPRMIGGGKGDDIGDAARGAATELGKDVLTETFQQTFRQVFGSSEHHQVVAALTGRLDVNVTWGKATKQFSARATASDDICWCLPEDTREICVESYYELVAEQKGQPTIDLAPNGDTIVVTLSDVASYSAYQNSEHKRCGTDQGLFNAVPKAMDIPIDDNNKAAVIEGQTNTQLHLGAACMAFVQLSTFSSDFVDVVNERWPDAHLTTQVNIRNPSYEPGAGGDDVSKTEAFVSDAVCGTLPPDIQQDMADSTGYLDDPEPHADEVPPPETTVVTFPEGETPSAALTSGMVPVGPPVPVTPTTTTPTGVQLVPG